MHLWCGETYITQWRAENNKIPHVHDDILQPGECVINIKYLHTFRDSAVYLNTVMSEL